jgi:hypothetical protein
VSASEAKGGVGGQAVFTTGREIDFDTAMQQLLSQFGAGGSWHDDSHEYRAHAVAAEHSDRLRHSVQAPGWFVIDSALGPELKRARRVAKSIALDHLAGMLRGADGKPLVVRGGATSPGFAPDEELRRKIRLFKNIQVTREAAFTYTGKGEYGGRDVPARLGLGGLQDFTPSEASENTHKRPKGYAPWRPHKKTTRLMFQVKQILGEYRDHLPLTARQIFYRMVAAYGYPKTEKAAKNLGEHLTRARRAEMIPFDHIRDDGISVMAQAHYADENDFFKHVREEGSAYKRDKLTRQKMDIRVYCEAAGMMPQLERVCEPYSIPVYSCSGFDGVSAKYQLKEACWRSFVYRGRQTIILHLGDYDPSGESIFNDGLVEDIHAVLERDVPHKEPGEVAVFERVALKVDHIERFNLPTAPPKSTDSRTKNWQGAATCQLEALPPDVLAGLLDATIKTYLNLAVYEQDLEAEEEERRRITKALPSAGGAAWPKL